MSRKEQAFITIYKEEVWRSNTVTDPQPLYVDAETLGLNKEIKSQDNMTRSGRAYLPDSQVSGPVKPGGDLTYQPRVNDLAKVLYSHFHYGTNFGGSQTPGTVQYVPAKNSPTYADIPPGEGGYGSAQGGVYSVSFLKKYFDTTDNDGTNTIIFRRGICDDLEFRCTAGNDLVVRASYRFRDYVEGSAVSQTPVGAYLSDEPWLWHQGTLESNGVSIGLESLSVRSSNNLVEKNRVGRENPEEFTFGDITVEGDFTLDFPTDGLETIGSMLDLKNFSLVGTFLSGTNLLAFEMPHCVRMPYDIFIEDRVTSTIPFKAFEHNDEAPIKITLTGNLQYVDWFLDALNGTRHLPDFTIYDAGTTSRTLSEYTFFDRDA